MTVHTHRVAFLRAVNLGKRRVPMKRLVELFDDLGFEDVSTFVNSGNVAFRAPGSRAALETRIENALEREFEFECTTFVRSLTELERTLQLDPFPLQSGDTYFVTFLKAALSPAAARMLERLSNSFDTLVVSGRDVHWRMRGKSTDSTLTTKDWNVVGRHRSTSRNVNMLRRLVAKLD